MHLTVTKCLTTEQDTPRVLRLLFFFLLVLTNLHLDGIFHRIMTKYTVHVQLTQFVHKLKLQPKGSATSCQSFSDLKSVHLHICAYMVTCLTANAHVKDVVHSYDHLRDCLRVLL